MLQGPHNLVFGFKNIISQSQSAAFNSVEGLAQVCFYNAIVWIAF